MNRLELVRDKVDKLLMQHENEEHRKKGFIHLYGVAQYCTLLALKRDLDMELCAIAGMLHDIYTYTVGYTKEHALFGAALSENLLTQEDVFTEEEIGIIVFAITNHSDKKTLHDPFTELLKDADTLQNSLYNPKIRIKHRKRLKLVLKELGVKTKLKDILDLDKENITEEPETIE